MIAFLTQFRLTLKYVRGVRNVTADALSRLFEDLTEEERVSVVPEPDSHDFVVSVTNPVQPDVQADSPPDLQSIDDQLISDGPETDSEVAKLPTIQEEHYLSDEEFQHTFPYKKYDELSDNEKIDKVTLLLSDQFVLEGEKLFRWSIPQKKKLQTVKPLTLRLCVPRSFRHDLIKHQYDVLGHFGVTRTFQSLVNNYFWKKMYKDVKEYGFTCDTCLCSKRHYGHRAAGLNPLELHRESKKGCHPNHGCNFVNS